MSFDKRDYLLKKKEKIALGADNSGSTRSMPKAR